MYVFKIGKMYLSLLSIDNYDNEISIDFTSNISSAKKINSEQLEVYNGLLLNLFDTSVESVAIKDE